MVNFLGYAHCILPLYATYGFMFELRSRIACHEQELPNGTIRPISSWRPPLRA